MLNRLYKNFSQMVYPCKNGSILISARLEIVIWVGNFDCHVLVSKDAGRSLSQKFCRKNILDVQKHIFNPIGLVLMVFYNQKWSHKLLNVRERINDRLIGYYNRESQSF